MRTFEMGIFEEIDTLVNDFFASWDRVITYGEPEEEEEEEEEESHAVYFYTEEEMRLANKYDDERGGYEFQIGSECGRAKCPTIYFRGGLKCLLMI